MRWLVCVHLRDEEAEHVLEEAIRWAGRAAATLDLLFVDESTGAPMWVSDPLSAQMLAQQWTEMRSAEADRLELLRQRIPEGHRGHATRVEGRAADEILAASTHYDAVVLAGRKHSAVGRALLGSVAAKVARHATVPVWVLPGRDHQLPVRSGPTRAVFGVDLRASDQGTGLADAAKWTDRLQGALDLVHIDPSRMHVPFIEDSAIRQRFETEWQQFRDRDIGAMHRLLASIAPSVRGTPRIEEGEAADGICAIAADYDVVLVATHGRTGLSRWMLGSVAERVLATCGRPVLLLRANPAH